MTARRAIRNVAGTVALFLAGGSEAQILPPQTVSEKNLQQICSERSQSHVGHPFAYPWAVGALPDVKDSLVIFVIPDEWKKISEPDRLQLMRDVACAYSGGRMHKDLWYSFSAVDPASKTVLETFPHESLWPKSGRYQ